MLKKFLAALTLTMAALLFVGLSVGQDNPTVTGKWHFVLQTEDGQRVFDPTFQQDGEKITGKWDKADVKGTFTAGLLALEFPVTSDEAGPGTLKLKGHFDADALVGDWNFEQYGGKFKATRSVETPAPAKP
jgi:hypothetical protein